MFSDPAYTYGALFIDFGKHISLEMSGEAMEKLRNKQQWRPSSRSATDDWWRGTEREECAFFRD